MRTHILLLACSFPIISAGLSSGQALRSPAKPSTAVVRGRITIDEAVGRKVQTDPLANLKIYLLRVDDSQPLVNLQESCRHAVANPNADPVQAYNLCAGNLRRAVSLVPTLHSVATTETNSQGQYEFDGVPAAGRYDVVGVKTVEGGEPIVMVGLTNRLRPGDHVTLNLSANDPWTTPVAP